MEHLRANKRIMLLMTAGVALCLSALASCGNLGLETPQEQDSVRMQANPPVVSNTADKHHRHLTQNAGSDTERNASPLLKVSATTADGQPRRPAEITIDCNKIRAERQKYYLQALDNGSKVEQVRVGATGYGAPPKNYYPEGQRRLMTIRAAKVDAYRALAEVVGGLHIWGGSAIGDMVVERDRYSVFVDAYVRGARVISVAPMEDGTYKTTVEMDVDQRFLSQVMPYIDPLISHQCDEHQAQQEGEALTTTQQRSVASSFYYSE